jgi:opacity protein-like surface antigen
MIAALKNLLTAGLPALLVLSALAGASPRISGDAGTARGAGPGTAVAVEFGAVDLTPRGCGSGIAYGLHAVRQVDRNVALELSLSRFSAPVEDGVLSLGKGRLSVIPATFSLIYRFGAGSRLIPYALMGAGFYLYSFAPETAAAAHAADVSDRLAAHLGAGLEYGVTRSWTVGVDARYAPVSTFVGPRGDVNPDPGLYPKVRLNQLAVRAVLRYNL